MFRHDVARAAGYLDLMSEALAGLFPSPVLEALIARLEVRG